MKKIKIAYWIFTVLFAGLMLFSAIPDIMLKPDAVKFMTEQLGYPLYLLAFLGWAKVLGVAGLFIPGMPRLREWAYAGLVIDLVGAIYSVIAIGTPFSGWIVMVAFLILPLGSYFFYRKMLNETNAGAL